MHSLHKQLLQSIQELSATNPFSTTQGPKYAGHSDKTYSLTNPQLKTLLNNWHTQHKDIGFNDFQNLLDSIYVQSESATEKYLGGGILKLFPEYRKQLDPKRLDRWLENLTGWAQIDSLCQSNFGAEEMLNNWDIWKKTLVGFNKSLHISKRRASLVLLTKPVRDSTDARLKELAFTNIDRLKSEKNKLISKAISWLLREMTKLHKSDVYKYVKENKEKLPAIAVRETLRKIETGKKVAHTG